MIIDKKIFEPRVSFLNKTHHIPKKEEYTYTKKIEGIKNTPVAPSFGKKLFHALTSLFHKIEIKFLIRNIKNNKLSSFVDINKNNALFNRIDNKINEIKKEIKCINAESKNVYSSFGMNSGSKDCCAQNEINKKEMEIGVLIKEKNEIKNKNLEAIKNIISHANDKFDFYGFCDYLTEIKRAKDFFSSLNDLAGGECSDSKLIVDLLKKIAINRIKAIDDKSINNIFKLVSLKFDFENVNLNKKYDFMHNFSSLKERDKFIKSINLLIISIDEGQILKKFDNNIKNEMENKLSIIMMIALGKNTDSEYSFDSLKQEWGKKYISDKFNYVSSKLPEPPKLINNVDIEHVEDFIWDDDDVENKGNLIWSESDFESNEKLIFDDFFERKYSETDEANSFLKEGIVEIKQLLEDKNKKIENLEMELDIEKTISELDKGKVRINKDNYKLFYNDSDKV